MKKLKYLLFTAGIILFCGCLKQKFFPDPNDPNLSKFTSHQFLTGTCYINNEVYINYFSSYPRSPFPKITKIVSPDADSIVFSWPLRLRKEDSLLNRKYIKIVFKIPVSKTFNRKDLNTWEGKICRSTGLTLIQRSFIDRLHGTGNLYFVKLKEINPGEMYISGLFNGQIGDSIFIKKGRFDYIVETGGF